MRVRGYRTYSALLFTFLLIGTTQVISAAIFRVNAGAGLDTNDGSSWSLAKKSVGAALSSAGTSDEIWVARGTYLELITLKESVEIYGGFVGSETARDQRDWKVNVSLLQRAGSPALITAPVGITRATVLDGFTIRNTGGYDGDAVIYCTFASPSITNNTITGSIGHGIYCSSSSPLITNNTISYHQNTAIVCVSLSAPKISNNRILGNSNGGISCGDSATSIDNNLISGNAGNGMFFSGAGRVVAINNTISGNTTGVYCYNRTDKVLANNIIAFNSIGIDGSPKGDGIVETYNNCVYNPGGVNYRNVPPGPTDILVDPEFASASNGHLHVQPDSPCVDAGLDSKVELDWTDIDGQPRVNGIHVDVGADESNGTLWPVQPMVVRVSPRGNDVNDGSSWTLAKKSVQAGIDAAASAGAEVWVQAALYTGRITLKPYTHLFGGFAGTEVDKINRNWTLNKTILDGDDSGTVVSVKAGYRVSTIDGFTVRNGSDGGIKCDNSSPTIRNNTVTENTDYYGAGIGCSSSSAMITGNAIFGNITTNTSGGGGLYCAGTGSPIITNNTIASNHANGSSGGGIFCQGFNCLPVITNNLIVGNVATEGGAIGCLDCNAEISNNIIAFNSSGVSTEYSSPYVAHDTPLLRNNCLYDNTDYNYQGLSAGTGDILADPLIAARPYGGIHIQANSPCINKGWNDAPWLPDTDADGQPRVQGGTVDIGADESDGGNPDSGPYVIVHVSPVGDDSNDGSSWTSAKKTVQAGLDAASAVGGDVWVKAGAYNERIVMKPYAHIYGGFGGVETSRTERNWRLNRTTIKAAGTGAVVTVTGGEMVNTVDGFVIRDGTGNGISCVNSSSIIANNTVTANMGFGIGCSYSSAVITNNTISENVVSSGYGGTGISCDNSFPVITNNIITANRSSSSEGGAIHCTKSSPMIANNTITDNISTTGGGGLYFTTSSPTVLNNIIAFNSSGVFSNGGTPVLSNNCVYENAAYNYLGLTAGGDDISVDPLLQNRQYRDSHIDPLSPCVNAGGNGAAGLPVIDMDGQPRVQGGAIDIGADESDGLAPAEGPYVIVRVSPSGDDLNDGSSWALAKKTVQAGLDAAGAIGGEAWVQASVYSERIELKPYSHLYGGFAGNEMARNIRDLGLNKTILDGAALGTVVTCLIGNHISTIDGFTIRNGKSSSRGGGLYCNYSSPSISNNEILNNSVTAQTAADGGGIYCSFSSAVIEHNRIVGNSAQHGGGLSCDVPSTLTIYNNTVTKNTATSHGGGIHCNSSSSSITNNIITENSTSLGNGGGIFCNGSSPLITNNTIAGNEASIGGGISCQSSSSVISNNIIAFNSSGIYGTGGPSLRNNCTYGNVAYNYSGLTAGTGDITLDPLLAAREYAGDVHIQPSSPCVNNGWDAAPGLPSVDVDGQVRVQGGTVDIGADESDGSVWPTGPFAVIKVKVSGNDASDGLTWGSAKKTVQAAIDAAGAVGGDVWVQAGVYNERITMKPYVYLYGGFAGSEATRDQRDWSANKTVLDGGGTGSVVVGAFGFLISAIDGFTIRNGNASTGGGIYCSFSSPLIMNNEVVGSTGYGVFALNSNPRITGNTIAGNTKRGINCSDSSPVIEHNTISRNDGGGINCTNSSPTIHNNTIASNGGNGVASGAGISCSSSNPTITGNTISGNCTVGSGGGISFSSSSKPQVAGNSIVGNSAASSGGGIYSSSASPIITNNIITSNSSGDGGGIYATGSSALPVIANNTIAGNVVSSNGGGIFTGAGTPTIANNIVAFNSSGIYRTTGTPTLRNNCVYSNAGYGYWGLTAGTGDIASDPVLANRQYGNVHVQPGSPCIDAGWDGVTGLPSIDIDGEARVQGGSLDIGADESNGTTWPVGPIVIVRVGPKGNDANDGSDWASAKKTVQAGIDAASSLGGEVWVQAALYSGRITLKPYAYVFGGFVGIETNKGQRDWSHHRSTLDGGGAGTVVTANAGTRVSAIDGFTIRNGKGSNGGGIYCNLSSPTITNNTITGNSDSGVYFRYSSAAFANNIVRGNTSSTNGGGIYAISSSPTITNNTITGNSASNGGAVYCTNSSPTMSSNIVAFNTKGIYRASGGLVLRNNCVYSNTAYNYLGSGLSAGPTDISVDPLFVNRPLDLHILPVSPCRDTGDDASIISGWVDMDGEARIQGAHVDIGADELWQTSLIWPKLSVDGSSADFGGVVVTAVFDGFFYVESKDRACGMRVVPTSGAGPQVGTIVRLIGTVRTNTDAERYLEATQVTPEGTGALAPLTMRIPRVGGQGWYTGAFPGIGQAGVEGGVGLNTIGLFVRTFGTVVNAESGFVTIAETITQGTPVSVLTLALPKGVPEPSPGSFVTVTGISSCAKSGNTIHPILLVPDASSITLAARS